MWKLCIFSNIILNIVSQDGSMASQARLNTQYHTDHVQMKHGMGKDQTGLTDGLGSDVRYPCPDQIKLRKRENNLC